MERIKLNSRLATAIPFVRQGSCFADVGTDHAHLPVYLVQSGIARRAIASDINEGPLARAKENIEEYGLADSISTVLCDGLSALESYSPTDIAIFGMGGELIVRIIDEASWLKDASKGIRLILQPMTHPEKLREYLAGVGFNVVGESLSSDRGRIYQTLCAEYDGIIREQDALALIFGECNLKNKDKLLFDLAKDVKKQAEKRRLGKIFGGEDVSREEELIRRLSYLLEEEK